MNVTDTVAGFIAESSFDRFPEKVVEVAKQAILDWVAVTLGGASDPVAKILIDHIEEIGGEKQSTILGYGIRTSTLNAALVNGAMSHILDFDDAHDDVRTHPSAPLLPSIIAIAEYYGLSGQDLLTAYIIGYEVTIRIGLALGKEYYEKGWHSTSILGRFGAAAGVSKLLRLNPEQISNALGLAATQTGGIRSTFGTMAKPFHAGKAAMDGMLSAMLAKRHFTGPHHVLEEHTDFVNLFSGEYHSDKITKMLGREYHVLHNHFKMHGACLLIHPAIDALIYIKEHFKPEPGSITSIEIEVAPLCLAVTNREKVTDSYEARFSIQFCSAVALQKGIVSPREVSGGLFWEADIKELMKKVNLTVNEQLEEWEADVVVRTRSGEEYRRHASNPKERLGDSSSFDDIMEKLRGLTMESLSADTIEEIGATVKHIDSLENISRLMDLCIFQDIRRK
ncbi:MAG: MmgE/PrpD family protein [Deltaproteobacteria bacterium]|nr:MmgE/PrpD family protein [Deltaproteobacteria bacterium]